MEILEQIRSCRVRYRVPGKTDRSAMPIGGGELCASVWTEKGTVCAYLSRSDALTELDRTVKLGQLRVEFSPDPFAKGEYEQLLCTDEGVIELQGRGCRLYIWIDREAQALRMTGRVSPSVQVRASIRTWRDRSMVPYSSFAGIDSVKESADILRDTPHGFLFYHKNGPTILPQTARLQQVPLEAVPDLLTGRIFGGLLRHSHRAEEYELSVLTHSAVQTEPEFEQALRQKAACMAYAQKSLDQTRSWWREYWNRSYLFVRGDTPRTALVEKSVAAAAAEPMESECVCPSAVTRAYVLTKYMTACCSGASMPIAYNGMLFNLCPGGGKHLTVDSFGPGFTCQPCEGDANPDERSWTTEILWQNVRHPYHSMLARGEQAPLRTLFAYYRRFWEVNRCRAGEYYKARGQHNTEMTLTCGLQSPGIYGTDRVGKHPGWTENRWGGAVEISPGLELAAMMLDAAEFGRDRALFCEMWEYLSDLLAYIGDRFARDAYGVLRLEPLHAVETYWDTLNPMPVVAGLHSVLGRVSRSFLASPEEKEAAAAFLRGVPPIPQRGGLLLAAEQCDEERHNVELPELYAVFPFRLAVRGSALAPIARETFRRRIKQFGLDQPFVLGARPDRASFSGWQPVGVTAALLGLTRQAALILEYNCALQNPGTRFPAMWGPIYDAVPDTDHGANILHLLQCMVMQTEGNQITLLPAFPREWDLRFKLYADSETFVEGEWKNGKMASLHLHDPAGRWKVQVAEKE